MANKAVHNGELPEIAYQRFQIFWLLFHSISMSQISQLADLWLEEVRDGGECISFEQFVNEHGFGGEIYPCYEEFLDGEYVQFPELVELLALCALPTNKR